MEEEKEEEEKEEEKEAAQLTAALQYTELVRAGLTSHRQPKTTGDNC